MYGHPEPVQGTWRDRLVWDQKVLIQKEARAADPRAAEAISDYRVLETFAETSLVEVRLQTGKRNQIRIQAALRGHALVGERQYATGPSKPPALAPRATASLAVAKGEGGRTGPTSFPLEAFSRQALHAHRLTFRHPVDDRVLTFEAPLPKDLSELLRRLRTGRATKNTKDTKPTRVHR